MTKINKQERNNQDKTKIGPFFDFLLRFSIFLVGIFSLASKLSCETMFKISSTNIEKCRRKSKKGPILVLSWLVLSWLIFVAVTLPSVRSSTPPPRPLNHILLLCQQNFVYFNHSFSGLLLEVYTGTKFIYYLSI